MKLTGFRLVGVDFLLMTLAFFGVNQVKRGTFDLPEGYGVLLGLFYGAWVVSGVMLGLELLVWGAVVRFWGVPQVLAHGGEASDDGAPAGRAGFSVKFVLVDLGLFFAAFFAVNFMKRGHFNLLPEYEQLMVMQLVLMAGVAFATQRYKAGSDPSKLLFLFNISSILCSIMGLECTF